MANWSLPTTASTYVNYTAELDGRLKDLAYMLDPASSTVTNAPNNAVRWNSAQNRWEKYSTATSSWSVLASTYAINAATASKLAAAVTINGVSFDGSASITLPTPTFQSLTFSSTGNGAASGTTFDTGTARIISYNSVGAPSVTGANATGTWSINITGSSASCSGNSATATLASSVTNGVYTTGDQTIGGTKTFTSTVNGLTSGATTSAAFFAATSGGPFASMNGRYAPYRTSVSHSGSSYAPALSVTYDYGGTWQGVYSIGHLTLNASNPGAFTIHHINSNNGQNNTWQFTGATGDFVSSGNVTAYSDESLKTDWQDIADDFVERLAQVKSGTYTRIDTGVRQVGASAQSLQPLLPEAVTLAGDKLSIAYGNAALAACIELAKAIVLLKQEVAALKGA